MSASPRIASPHDHLDRLDAPSIARLKAVVRDLHGQCRSGWDINLIQRLHEELGLLAGLCNHAGQLQLGEQLLALETALGPALTRQRVPDTGTTALVAALADHLRVLIPVTAPEPATAAPPQTAPTTATAPNGREKADPLRLLIASLRPDVAAHLAASLPTGSGYTLRILSEPLAALEELSRFAPDCVICDLKMPVCDGPDLAAMIHERADFADLPVLYLSIAGEAPSDADTLPADIDAQSLDACVRERVATRQQRQRQNATTQLDHRRGQYRRAWLLDRLDACLTAGNPRGGLLDISIDGAAALQRQHGNHAVTVMHEQLSDAINELLAAGDMLASSGAGFLLLCRERSRENLYALAEEVRLVVAGQRFGPAAVPISITIGGCILNGGLDAVDSVVSAAQRARQSAPAGHIAWHHHGNGTLDPLQIEAALRKQRLHLVYQAIVNIAGAPSAQYQALLRMRDHEGFVHTAAELLPVARRGGLIPALDRWSLDQGLQLLANHQRQTRPLRLFISQCSESLKERDYPAWLASRLQAHGVRSTRLVLDFRCDDVSDSPRELLHAAPRLKALGVGLSLSGADRSLQTAQLLDAVAFDYLRLAASISANPGALVPIAHARKMAVIAPQIEDESLIQSLRSHGVDFVQGNSLAHPARSLNYSFDGAAASA